MAKRKRLTLKQKKFLKLYMESGNAKQSALAVYDCKESTASQIGAENLRKLHLPIQEMMEARGLSDNNLIGHMIEGLEKPVKVTADGIETPDYSVRHRYLETSLRLKGHGKQAGQVNVQLNVQPILGSASVKTKVIEGETE